MTRPIRESRKSSISLRRQYQYQSSARKAKSHREIKFDGHALVTITRGGSPTGHRIPEHIPTYQFSCAISPTQAESFQQQQSRFNHTDTVRSPTSRHSTICAAAATDSQPVPRRHLIKLKTRPNHGHYRTLWAGTSLSAYFATVLGRRVIAYRVHAGSITRDTGNTTLRRFWR
ncbi:hypothetical protein BDV96DRAFT_199839 [Lophiotrema nucula]|uniref:Uncharacterized protein n=1 Tax=Lophiotrema nucula TaxID=690887 RepID=A0A6A5YSZ9_9PLEO|nr:hypothetical protein BDV96DRAFT_199839 [Lophiotrema nucula]